MNLIHEAFKTVQRQNFVPEFSQDQAIYDIPVPIGFGQTNSQPSTVEMMLQWLEPGPGNKILDLGSGSGWTTALLAKIVGEKGVVHAVEIIPELVEFGRQNCKKYRLKNILFHESGKKYGLPKESPFDRILVSAAADQLPQELVEQLALGGKMVIPIRSDILVIKKARDGTITSDTHPGFAFVPLV